MCLVTFAHFLPHSVKHTITIGKITGLKKTNPNHIYFRYFDLTNYSCKSFETLEVQYMEFSGT